MKTETQRTDCRLPWRVIEVNGIWEVWTAEDDRPGSKNNYCIAADIQDEREAELIASAPTLKAQRGELLKALRAVVAALSQPVQLGTTSDSITSLVARLNILKGDCEFTRNTANQAIAKAMGKGN